MTDKYWEEMPMKDRKEVYRVYRKTLMEKEGVNISFQECEQAWIGRKWIFIKYTFGIEQ